jgi:hypothetical protein
MTFYKKIVLIIFMLFSTKVVCMEKSLITEPTNTRTQLLLINLARRTEGFKETIYGLPISSYLPIWVDELINITTMSRNLHDVESLEQIRTNPTAKRVFQLSRNMEKPGTYIFTPKKGMKSIIHEDLRYGFDDLLEHKQEHLARMQLSPCYSSLIKKMVEEKFEKEINSILEQYEEFLSTNAYSKTIPRKYACTLATLLQLSDITPTVKVAITDALLKISD